MAIKAFGRFMFDPYKVISVEPRQDGEDGAIVTLGEGSKITKVLEIDAEAADAYRAWSTSRSEDIGFRSIPLHRQ
jgi:hypothetical protein